MLIRYWNSCILYLMAAHLCLASGELIGKVLLEKGHKLAIWKTVAILGVSIALVFFFLQIMPGFGREQFYVTIGLYLVVLSYDRSFRRTVFVFLVAYAGILLFASLGLLLGYTDDSVRFTDYGAKHTFGMVHPNTAAHIIFVIVFCVWYLFLQKRRVDLATTVEEGRDAIESSNEWRFWKKVSTGFNLYPTILQRMSYVQGMGRTNRSTKANPKGCY